VTGCGAQEEEALTLPARPVHSGRRCCLEGWRVIKKVGKQWCVFNSTGTKELGCHDTKQAALKQLAAIEISKQKRGKR
jgi:hypothetical protein